VSKMIGGKEDITHKVIDKLREAFPLLNINWLLYNDGEMFSAAKQNGMLVVKEPQALYGPESKEDLFGDLRALLEHSRYRIEGLEAEVGRLGERVLRLLYREGKLKDITGLSFYSLKDSLAIYLLENGVDVESAMRHFRHSSLEMFQRYVKRLGVVNERIKGLPVDL